MDPGNWTRGIKYVTFTDVIAFLNIAYAQLKLG